MNAQGVLAFVTRFVSLWLLSVTPEVHDPWVRNGIRLACVLMICATWKDGER